MKGQKDIKVVEEMRTPLLARRIPREAIVPGKAYVIHARNGGVGVAVIEDGQVGYMLRRVKFDHRYLFVEIDWDHGAPFGTAIPLQFIEAEPPAEKTALLDWLAEREAEHREAIQAAWDVVLGRNQG